jgi:hypothetical protein
MSAGSGASNLGYGHINPYNNSPHVNGTSSNYSGSFSSNEIPGLPGLAGAKLNTDAASGKVPGICMKRGGTKRLKRKIKNITKQYKRMKKGSSRLKSLKKRLISRTLSRQFAGKRRTRSRRSRSRRQRGGYAQYMNNMPNTPSYQVAGINLSPDSSMLATPGPQVKLDNCVNCVDNYNRYTNTGFPSKGH